MRQPTPTLLRHPAFTLLEFLASIAILGVLLASAVFYISGYISSTRTRADQITLQTLNDALTRYKTQGGAINSLTLGAPIANVLSRLGSTLNWNGFTHTVLNRGFTAAARSLEATGTGSQYRFFRYHTHSDNIPTASTPTSTYPYGQEVGYIAKSSGTYDITIDGTTSHIAFKNAAGVTTIYAEGALTLPASSSYTFWACAGAADSTPTGTIGLLIASDQTLSGLNVRGLSDLNELYIANTGITSLDIGATQALRNGTLQCNMPLASQLSSGNWTGTILITCYQGDSAASLSGNIYYSIYFPPGSWPGGQAELETFYDTLPTTTANSELGMTDLGINVGDYSTATARGWGVNL